MSFSIYEAAIPPMVRGLENLSNMLGKAAAQAKSDMRDPGTLLKARLAPDMLPLSRQVKLATDAAADCVSQLTGGGPPTLSGGENSFPELQQRIANTVDYLKASRPEQFESAGTRTVNLSSPQGPVRLPGGDFLTTFCIPNFYFHVTIAFATLRQGEIRLGKLDCVGQQPR